MGMYNKSKFVFSETFNNDNGKTSGSGFIGVMFGILITICFAATMVGWFLKMPNALEVMGILLQFAGIDALFLGVRKVSSRFGKSESVVEGETDPNVQKPVVVDKQPG